MSVNEDWQKILKDKKIVDYLKTNDFFVITADEIKDYHEPRLMTKFDSSKDVPESLANEKLGILPLSNGKYAIGRFKLFKNIKNIWNNEKTNVIEMNTDFQTLDPDNIESEARALHVASITGIIDDFCNDQMKQTISGRMRTLPFSFNINTVDGKNVTLNVERTQIEVDAGYEGNRCVALFEAKNKKIEDFIIRQLYYPYRFWNERVVNKEIKPMFFIYESGIYYLAQYRFADINNYNSIKLVKAKKYSIKYCDSSTIIRNILDGIDRTIPHSDNECGILPQANSISKMIDVLEYISEETKSYDEISNYLGYTRRQGSYYPDALAYIGLVNKINNVGYELTEEGLNVLNSNNVRTRNRRFIEAIARQNVFYDMLALATSRGENITKEEAIDIINDNSVEIAESTVGRRAESALSWINWMFSCEL